MTPLTEPLAVPVSKELKRAGVLGAGGAPHSGGMARPVLLTTHELVQAPSAPQHTPPTVALLAKVMVLLPLLRTHCATCAELPRLMLPLAVSEPPMLARPPGLVN